VKLFDVAMRHCPQAPLLHFNRGIALEDGNRLEEALQSYERCLELAPNLADAHYNAARLYEQRGQAQLAVRHYSAYRRLQE
jgi:tetratricopeptide (TPR) repeat protein